MQVTEQVNTALPGIYVFSCICFAWNQNFLHILREKKNTINTNMIFTLKQIYRLYFHINFQPFLQLKKWKCVGKIQLSTWVYFTWPVNVQMMKVREYFPNVTCHIRKRKAIICHINAVNTKSYNKVRRPTVNV